MIGSLDIQPTPAALIRGAAERIDALMSEGVRSRGRGMIALSGGSTPRNIYSMLGSEPFRSRIPWEHIHCFWGDERCVPADHPESNYRMAHEALLRHIDIPSGNVHRIRGELDPAVASREYEEELRRSFGLNAVPRFDLVLLGLGEDGHTASLFPGTSSLQEKQRIVTEVYIEKFKSYRITLTLPVINNASHILFLVSGKSKATILNEVLNGDPLLYPAGRVRPGSGGLHWLVDQDAAGQVVSEG